MLFCAHGVREASRHGHQNRRSRLAIAKCVQVDLFTCMLVLEVVEHCKLDKRMKDMEVKIDVDLGNWPTANFDSYFVKLCDNCLCTAVLFLGCMLEPNLLFQVGWVVRNLPVYNSV